MLRCQKMYQELSTDREWLIRVESNLVVLFQRNNIITSRVNVRIHVHCTDINTCNCLKRTDYPWQFKWLLL